MVCLLGVYGTRVIVSDLYVFYTQGRRADGGDEGDEHGAGDDDGERDRGHHGAALNSITTGEMAEDGRGEGGRQSQQSQAEAGKACVAQVEEGGVGIASVVARTDVPAPALPEVHGGVGAGGRAGALRGRLLLLLGARDGTVARGVGHRFRSFVAALLILAVRALQLLRDLGEERVRRGEAEQLCANKNG